MSNLSSQCYIVNYGLYCAQAEGENMSFVARSSEIRVLRVYTMYQSAGSPGTETRHLGPAMVMDNIRYILCDIWHKLHLHYHN